MHDKIKALKKENNELRKSIGTFEQKEEDINANDAVKREKAEEEHKTGMKEIKDDISRTKVELDKVMSRPL